MKYDS